MEIRGTEGRLMQASVASPPGYARLGPSLAREPSHITPEGDLPPTAQ